MPSPDATRNLINRIGINSAGTLLAVDPTLPSAISSVARISRTGLYANVVRDRITFTAAAAFGTADNASLGSGLQILALGARKIRPIAGALNLVLSNSLALGETTAGEIGIGTVVASGAVAVLSGTATFENFLTGQTLSSITAGSTITADFAAGNRDAIGSRSVASNLFLNIASAYSDEASAHGHVIDSGFLELTYEILEN